MQRLEMHDVVRVARLDVTDRPYDGSPGTMRAPRIGDEGTVVWVDEEGPARGSAMVECVADDGTTIWLSDFTEHELELVARSVEGRKPRRRSVRRSALWIGLALITLTASGIGVCYVDPRSKEVAYPAIGISIGLAALFLSVLDLGKALVELPAPTPAQRALGFVLRVPRALFGLATLALATWFLMRSFDAANHGDTEALKFRIGSAVAGIVGLRSLQQAFRRQLRVDRNAPPPQVRPR